MNRPNYKFYATLLDSYQWYLDSEQDEAFKDFINKINRVPYAKSDAALKGIAFNDLLDDKTIEKFEDKPVKFNSFDFKGSVLNDFKAYFSGAASQVYTSAQIEINGRIVTLYGFVDKVKQDAGFDIKTMAKYEFPKFIFNWQHKVYPYTLNKEGIYITRFEYTVTDFNNIFREEYVYNPERDIPALQGICASLIDFIETHRGLITDKKIFALY